MEIKETKEALVGVLEISVALASVLKDGVQLTDAADLYAKIWADEAVKAKVLAAIENVKQVPAEVKDITVAEGIDLAIVAAQYVPKIIDALKKEPVVA